MTAARICDGCGKAEKLANKGPADSGLPEDWVKVYVSSSAWMDPPPGALLDACSAACAGRIASKMAHERGARPGILGEDEAF